MDRAGVINRMARLGIRPAADALREEIRARHKAAGMTRDKASEAAWVEMAAVFEPVAAKLEKEQADNAVPAPEPPAPQLAGLPDDTDSLLDPDYSEPDAGKQLRDGLLWAALEFHLVIHDTPSGPVATIEAATNRPPNPFALFILSTYALGPIERRRDLIGRALGFATKGHDEPNSKGQQREEGGEGGFLDKVGDTSPP